jgi:hypothetical protein
MIELDKTDDVATAAAAISIEQALVAVQPEAWFVIRVQRTPIHRFRVSAGGATNPVPADSRGAISAVSDRRQLLESRAFGPDGQNTADDRQIPGKEGGWSNKVLIQDDCQRRTVAGSGDRVAS